MEGLPNNSLRRNPAAQLEIGKGATGCDGSAGGLTHLHFGHVGAAAGAGAAGAAAHALHHLSLHWLHHAHQRGGGDSCCNSLNGRLADRSHSLDETHSVQTHSLRAARRLGRCCSLLCWSRATDHIWHAPAAAAPAAHTPHHTLLCAAMAK